MATKTVLRIEASIVDVGDSKTGQVLWTRTHQSADVSFVLNQLPRLMNDAGLEYLRRRRDPAPTPPEEA